MKYFLFIIFLSSVVYSNPKESLFIYNDVYGAQKGLFAPNVEVKLFDISNDTINEGSLRVRGGVALVNLVLFSFRPSYLAGLHYVVGQEKKLDLGAAIVYENYNKGEFFNTATSVSFTIGFRQSLGKIGYSDNWFIGFAMCPTYAKENKPFYPVSLKLGFSL